MQIFSDDVSGGAPDASVKTGKWLGQKTKRIKGLLIQLADCKVFLTNNRKDWFRPSYENNDFF